MHKEVIKSLSPETVKDGAGVRLKRLIGGRTLDSVDPFLLLDHFGSDDPDDYLAGFPMHPHRGLETVTYMLEGRIKHKDSVGNAGSIEKGDVQWMTAGSGIMHEEMPELVGESLDGFQLWLNLSRKEKMIDPVYQEFKASEIPTVSLGDAGVVRIVSGDYRGTLGPVKGTSTAPVYMDIELAPGAAFSYDEGKGLNAAVYVFRGDLELESDKQIYSESLIVFSEDGDEISFKSGKNGARCLLLAAKPLREPVARYGPFVMNTQGEIRQAIIELQEGTFVKKAV